MYVVSYAQALLTCYLIPATKGWGRGRLTTILGFSLQPSFSRQERGSWKRGWPEKLKYACAGAEQVNGKKGNDIVEMTTI